MKQCPICRSTEGVREYFYGMPTEAPDPAKFVIGGRVVFEDMPDYKCLTCSTDFYEKFAKYHNRFVSSDASGISFQCPNCKEWYPAVSDTGDHKCSID